jgi:hypothetical protein
MFNPRDVLEYGEPLEELDSGLGFLCTVEPGGFVALPNTSAPASSLL